MCKDVLTDIFEARERAYNKNYNKEFRSGDKTGQKQNYTILSVFDEYLVHELYN